MKKRFSLFLLIAALVLAVFAFSSCNGNDGDGAGNGDESGNANESSSTEGLVFGNDESGNYAVTGYTGSSAEVYIPASNDGKAVVSIAKNAFRRNGNITAVHLPSSLKVIGESSFQECSALKSAEFNATPNTLAISASAFSGCPNLEKFTPPESTVSIGEKAFSGCGKLTTKSAESTYVGNWLIMGASVAKPIIKSGTVGIADQAFASDNVITEAAIPSSVKYIGNNAFTRCGNLKKVVFAKEGVMLKSIGDEAFLECTSFAKIMLPESLEHLGNKALYKCPNLSLSIASGNKAFKIREGMLIDVKSKTVLIGADKVDVNIPGDEGIEFIAPFAFEGMTAINRLTIPASIKEIGNHAFVDCSNLKSVTFEEGSKLTKIGDSAFYSNEWLGKINLEDLENLKEISRYAFHSTGISSVTIPASVEIIGDQCFAHCQALTSFSFAEGCKVTKIPASMLEYCRRIPTITIPETITSIGSKAFAGCIALGEIYIPSTVTEIKSKAFGALDDPMNITIKCEVSEAPAGWDSNWNGSECEPSWNVAN